ncbi:MULTISPECIES: hypothetical protein [Bradyrhizobium]|uniref:hypothetical protein n=1 Tax=Bradyrhizobium TaxID=374 RepID=UPI0011777FEE|nr:MULTISPECIES: hypothetical protein [Bradyrhizobium]WOH60266.1 hypothetical protein RX329_09220 [Bradyrhizobium sp. BWC-3-1]
MRYVAYVVDLSGVARAAYEIDSPTDQDAKTRAEKFLDAYPAVEVWDGPRKIARLVRESADCGQEKRS